MLQLEVGLGHNHLTRPHLLGKPGDGLDRQLVRRDVLRTLGKYGGQVLEKRGSRDPGHSVEQVTADVAETRGSGCPDGIHGFLARVQALQESERARPQTLDPDAEPVHTRRQPAEATDG